MNLETARAVLLARSFESQQGAARILGEREWADCTRAGLVTPGGNQHFEVFLAARAAAAGALLRQRQPALAALPLADAGFRSAQAVLIALGLLTGLGTNLFNGSDRFNLFAPGVVAVLVWNLVFLTALLISVAPRRAGGEVRTPGQGGGLAIWLSNYAQRRLARMGTTQPPAMVDFLRDWHLASRPLLSTRFLSALHLASAALALGLIAGMYGRGLIAEYHVVWGSTFIGAEQAHAWLSAVLWPAGVLTGIPLPDSTMLDALRHDLVRSAAAASAAPWIHLYAVMLGLVVVVPRLLLALYGRWQAARLRAHFPMALTDAYFAPLARLHAAAKARALPPLTGHLQLAVMVFPWALSAPAEAGLRALVAAALGDAVELTLIEAGPDPEQLPLIPPASTHRLVICDLTSTPEADTHGPLLRPEGRLPVALLLDESRFRERFGDGSARLVERRDVWRRFAAAAGVRGLSLPLAGLDPHAQAVAFRTLLGLGEGGAA